MRDMFSVFDGIMANAIKHMDDVFKEMDDHLEELKKNVASGKVKVRNFIIKDGKLVELPMVPTTDRISYTKKPTKMTNVATNPIKSKKIQLQDEKNNSKFTSLEEKKIRNLREKGWSIKKIARSMKRSDKAISEFVRSEGI